MNEIVFRRYDRLITEGKSFPDLVVIDGGKGQLNAACDALKELNIYGKIPIVGIAKRLEEIYYPEDTTPIHINKKSKSLALLQRVRDEAHRFAITFHRDLRSASSLNSELDNISGIGSKTVEKILLRFKTIGNIQNASLALLEAEVGQSRAQKIYDYFQTKKEG